MSRIKPRFVFEFEEIYSEYLDRARSLIVDGYWYEKKYRMDFKSKFDDFKHTQNATEGVIETLNMFIDAAEGERNKPGVQPMINAILSIINIHLDRISKYYPKNKPKGFQKKEHQREEGKFQQIVFKGEQEIRVKLRSLNIDNNMDDFVIKFFDDRIATLPMKQVLCDLVPDIAAKIESLEIDWDLIMDNGLLINMHKRDIPDYNDTKHFWDQDLDSLQFWVSEWNKINRGITIDGYFMSPWMYFHLNYFKTPIKNQGNKILNPPLRDNEWYVDEIKKDAKERAKKLESAGIIIYGTRRFGKSTVEASHCHHGLLIYPTETGTITASNGEDLASITDKMSKSMDYIHPAFAVTVLKNKSWESGKETDIGIKSKSGAKTYLLFKFFITNTDSGSAKGSQKTAGGNPIVFVADEIGKEEFLSSYRAAIPSFESDNGWVCQPMYVGTGGNEDLSADAEKALSDPANSDFIEMNWDILEFGIPKNLITWNRRKFGWFIPAQMSTKTGFRKIETNFAEFLGIDSDQLRKIKFFRTDWEHNNNVVKERRAKLTGTALQQEIVFRPIDPEECFMSAKKNPFPASNIKRHKEKLQSEGDKVYGKARKIGLRRTEDNNIEMFLDATKEVNAYPHNGSFTDCPFLLYEDFPEERPKDEYRFVAGLDDYKQDESEGDSIGAFYIFDRLKRKIVLSLANRPDPHSEFHRQMHLALDAWNCMCFMENEDMDFKKYLDRVSNPSIYLYKGFDAHDDFSKFQNGKRKFGWRPDKNTVPIVRGYSIDYAKDDSDYYDNNDNLTHTVSGYERIEDIQLLEEMIKFKPGGNFDRLVAFSSCLAIDYYLTCNYLTPRIPPKKKENEEQNQKRRPRKKSRGFFSKGRNSLFSR